MKPKVQHAKMPFHRLKEHLIKGKRKPLCVHEGVHLLDRLLIGVEKSHKHILNSTQEASQQHEIQRPFKNNLY